MDRVTLFKSLERPVRWRQGMPGLVLTSGMLNKFTVELKDSPSSASHRKISAVDMILTIRDLPALHIVRLKADPVVIPPDSTCVDVGLSVPGCMPRGYYQLHCVFRDEAQQPVNVYQGWLCVDKAVDPKPDHYMTLDSVRMQFADICEDDNKLLESVEIGTGDIIEAVNRAIQQWNNRGPVLNNYTGASFPYPEVLRCGTIFMLMQSLWTFLERNRMTYQSGGVTVDLERRADAVKQLIAVYQRQWIDGMSQMKNEENLRGFQGLNYYV